MKRKKKYRITDVQGPDQESWDLPAIPVHPRYCFTSGMRVRLAKAAKKHPWYGEELIVVGVGDNGLLGLMRAIQEAHPVQEFTPECVIIVSAANKTR